jgi:hypothetical protein
MLHPPYKIGRELYPKNLRAITHPKPKQKQRPKGADSGQNKAGVNRTEGLSARKGE